MMASNTLLLPFGIKNFKYSVLKELDFPTICVMAKKSLGKTSTLRKIIYYFLVTKEVDSANVHIFKASTQEQAFGTLPQTLLTEDALNKVLKSTRNNPNKSLIVFDDVTQNELFLRSSVAFRELLYNSRHHRCYIVIATHSFTLLKSSMRNLISIWIFPSINNRYIRDYIKEIDPDLPKAKLEYLASLSTDKLKKRYSLLVLNTDTISDLWSVVLYKSPDLRSL